MPASGASWDCPASAVRWDAPVSGVGWNLPGSGAISGLPASAAGGNLPPSGAGFGSVAAEPDCDVTASSRRMAVVAASAAPAAGLVPAPSAGAWALPEDALRAGFSASAGSSVFHSLFLGASVRRAISTVRACELTASGRSSFGSAAAIGTVGAAVECLTVGASAAGSTAASVRASCGPADSGAGFFSSFGSDT
ncbi:hypothetical protein [Nocardia goodfellowii]|uniref:Uncharacterized protein n=1 Tax=Nocardia goodfellowii TaxID=882446 RepID=A0ABS4QAE7_9NOCA|nr:hypothetical protein [Nocardia goodfellowii]MBP2188548.1 hypothetical protein [Nocardia goodfellowii]